MHDRALELVQELMEELQGKMEYSGDDLSERLGRKPEVKVMKIEGEMPEDGMEEMDEMGMMDPEDKLKERLRKLRG